VILKAFFWTFLLGGVLSFAYGAYLTAYLLTASGRAADTTGTIVRVIEVSEGLGSQRRTGLIPVVRFQTEAGETIEFEGYYSKVATAGAGTPVPVRYDPQSPRWAVVYESAWSVWFWPAFGYSLGLVFAAVAPLFLLARRLLSVVGAARRPRRARRPRAG
jgi:hypothetical protein